MHPVEIDFQKDPFVKNKFPEQNIEVKSYFLDLFGNPIEKLLNSPGKMQEIALVTVVKPYCIPQPHKHKNRPGLASLKGARPLSQIITKFCGKDVFLGPPRRDMGRYVGTEEVYYRQCDADVWTFYGGNSHKFERTNLMEKGPLPQNHNTDNATAIVKLSNNRPVSYITLLWPALHPREMFYPADLSKVIASYYQKHRKENFTFS